MCLKEEQHFLDIHGKDILISLLLLDLLHSPSKEKEKFLYYPRKAIFLSHLDMRFGIGNSHNHLFRESVCSVCTPIAHSYVI